MSESDENDYDIGFNLPADAGDQQRRIAANIAHLRKAAGMSQTALADAMRTAGQDHWRQNTVSRVERGAQRINVGEIRDLSRILGGSVLAGTRVDESVRDVGRSAIDAAVANKLARADRALSDALEQIRALRYVYDDKFSADHPEYGNDED